LLLNYTKYGNFNLWKIVKIVATRCQILRVKCTKFDFGWSSAPDPLRELSALPRLLIAGFSGGPLLEERRGRAGREEEEGEKIRQRREKHPHPLCIGSQCANPALSFYVLPT
jgi:hypothetical protein